MKRLIPLVAVLLLSACAGAQLERQKKEIDSLREKAGQLMADAKTKSDEADAAKAAKAEVEARLADAQSKLDIAGARIDSLVKSNKELSDTAGADETALNAKLRAAVAEKDELARKLSEAQKEKVALERTKNIYRAGRDKAQADLAKASAERDELKAKLAALDAEKAKLDEERAAAKARNHEALGSVADALLKELQSGQVTSAETGSAFALTLSNDVLFDEGSAKLRDGGAALLDRMGRALKTLGPREVAIAVHTDDAPLKRGLLGGFDSPWDLTSARASAIARRLHEHAGLDPAHLSAEGFGEFRPLKPNDSAESRAANRRIVVEVSPVGTPLTE